MRDIVLIVHNVRSAHNVGALLRTADGLGVSEVVLSGYTPYPPTPDDSRLPHIGKQAGDKIHKTALGAEQSVKWAHTHDISGLMAKLKRSGYTLAALEQADQALPLSQYSPRPKTALLVGSEVGGLSAELIQECDVILEIPMRGRKESFNVAAAAAMALYHLTYLDKPDA